MRIAIDHGESARVHIFGAAFRRKAVLGTVVSENRGKGCERSVAAELLSLKSRLATWRFCWIVVKSHGSGCTEVRGMESG